MKNRFVEYADYYVACVKDDEHPYHFCSGNKLILTYKEWKKYFFLGIKNSKDHTV